MDSNEIPITDENKQSDIPQKVNRIDYNLILDTIKKNAPVSLPNLKKLLPQYGGTSIWNAIKTFEFAGLIKTRIILNAENKAEKQIIIPEVTK